ncbi:hypothetical protein [Paracoccus isoporae]|uniref:hypothetical protein n=1 Tax=Paracoccus isoporae TaxID=591205 RepID=UPI000B81C180|nr:hypothetical protein [Paracoccus isoporae]
MSYTRAGNGSLNKVLDREALGIQQVFMQDLGDIKKMAAAMPLARWIQGSLKKSMCWLSGASATVPDWRSVR